MGNKWDENRSTQQLDLHVSSACKRQRWKRAHAAANCLEDFSLIWFRFRFSGRRKLRGRKRWVRSSRLLLLSETTFSLSLLSISPSPSLSLSPCFHYSLFSLFILLHFPPSPSLFLKSLCYTFSPSPSLSLNSLWYTFSSPQRLAMSKTSYSEVEFPNSASSSEVLRSGTVLHECLCAKHVANFLFHNEESWLSLLIFL